MYTKRNLVSAILAVAILLLTAIPARPATPEQIEAAINDGVDWLVDPVNINADGSWGNYAYVAVTGLAVVKLQDRAREVPTNEYDDEIQAGLDYIFGQATIDPYPPDTGISFAHGGWNETYCTGIAMMAIANDGDLSQLVTTGPAAGQTYGHVLQGNVDFFVSSQHANGGWAYSPGDWPDQSNSGYAVLGLSYAKDAGIDTSAVDTGLLNWINIIQAANGGSSYTPGGGWENELKTGNLIFQMTFLGIGPGDPAFNDAIAYIEAHWQDNNADPGWGYNTSPAGYQAMYCLMKGLEYSGVDEIDTDGVPGLEDWFNQEPPAVTAQDFASVLVAQQDTTDGSWPASNWGDSHLSTCWALLTLQKVTVVHHIEVPVDIKPTSCPNPLNLKGKGVLPVAVLGTEDFDVGMIDPDTVVLSREGVEAIVPVLRWAYEDVATPFEGELCDCHDLGADGYIDLTLKFSTAELVEALKLADVAGGTIPLTLTGNLSEEFGGTPIRGEDCVWVLREKGPQK